MNALQLAAWLSHRGLTFPQNYLAVLPAIRSQQGLSDIALHTEIPGKAIITRKPPPENDRRRE